MRHLLVRLASAAAICAVLAGCARGASTDGTAAPASALASDSASGSASPGAAAGSASDVGVTPTSIVIGATVPLSGPAAAYGTIARASDAYFHYINDQGGVYGRMITYKYLDDAYSPAQTVPLTRQLVEQDQVFLTFGSLGTQSQTAVRDYLNTRSVPQIMVATGATTFEAELDKYPLTYGWQPVYQGEALIYAQYLLQHSPNAKLGILYQNDDYGQDYLDGLTKGLGTRATEMIVDKESNDVGAPDLSSQILKLKNSGADTLFVLETPSPAIKAIVSAYQAGWHPTIYLNSVSAPVPYVQAVQQAAGDAAAVEGVITALYTRDPADPSQANDPGIQLYRQVMQQYYPDGKLEDNFNVYGVASAWTLVDVLMKAGPNLTRQAVVDQMNQLSETDNPLLAPGVSVKNSATDRYSITQMYLAKYSPTANDYQALTPSIDVRGQITFP